MNCIFDESINNLISENQEYYMPKRPLNITDLPP